MAGDAQGHVTPDMQQDGNSDISIESLDLYGSTDGTQLMSVLRGTIAVKEFAVPPVPFTVTTTETGRILPSSGDIHLISVDAVSSNDKDTGALDTEVGGLDAAAALVLGLLGFPGFDRGADTVKGYVANELERLTANSLRFLPFVTALFPVRVLLPGTSERLVFPYSGFLVPSGGPRTNNAPKGFGALARLDANGAQVFVRRGLFVAYGAEHPKRVARVPFLAIKGPSKLEFPRGGSRSVAGAYTAITNDEAVPPLTITWSHTILQETKGITVTRSFDVGQATTVTFADGGIAEDPHVSIRLTARMDDQLHLRDANGRAPTATRVIEVSNAKTATSGAGGGGAGGKGGGKSKDR